MAGDRLAAAGTDREATLVRFGGLVAIAAAVLEVVTTALSQFATVGDAVEIGDVVATNLLLGLVGVAAVYVRYEGEFEAVGELGLGAIAAGAVVGLATVRSGSVAASLLNLFPVFGGAALLAVDLWRAPTAPRGAAVLMGLAPVFAVLGVAPFSVAPASLLGPVLIGVLNVVWGAAWIILGSRLFTEPRPTEAGGGTRVPRA